MKAVMKFSTFLCAALAYFVILVVLQLEASNKWPNNIDAIRYLKAAFYIQLAKSLKKYTTEIRPDHLILFKVSIKSFLSCPKVQ